ncbi:MAG: class I SAM-dependent methyltransferase [Bacteroidia bacterium]|jgi:trans-aconitate methyltransferase|nr:class I SAM-dependent methyltransferase [Bacteroidia bacterium]
MEDDRYKATADTFNSFAETYLQRFGEETLYHDTFDALCKLLPPHSKLLEAGCGPGHIARYLLAQRPDLQITGTDIAPAMIELARKTCPGATFVVKDIRTIYELGNGFHALLCGFVTPYLSKTDCVNLLTHAHEMLTENGLVYISTIEGDYEKSDWKTGSSGTHRAFQYYYRKTDWENLFSETGFEIIGFWQKNLLLPNGNEEAGLVFIARKQFAGNKK